MRDAPYAGDFGPFGNRIWLNTAHQGPLPKPAVEAAHRAIAERISPHKIGDADFFEAPARLRRAIAQLISASPEDVILGNSTSFGLDLLANAMPWKASDEVLLVCGDFPADITPWLLLQDQGIIRVRFIDTSGGIIEADHLAAALTPRTRLFCTSWVNSFNGYAVDFESIGRLCRSRGVIFVLNASQALGARILNVTETPVDAVTCCGYKWLCGPYATGFCWIAPSLRDSLVQRHGYWLPMQAGRPLDDMRDTAFRRDLGARAWDVFCTANFLNFKPWTAAIEYLLGCNLISIANYDDRLVSRLVDGLDRTRFELISPPSGPHRSTLVIIRPLAAEKTLHYHRTLHKSGIDAGLREGCIRFAPHIHNTPQEIDRVLEVLARA